MVTDSYWLQSYSDSIDLIIWQRFSFTTRIELTEICYTFTF